MRVLALDTAAARIALAIGEFTAAGVRIIASREVDAARRANQMLLVSIDAMLEECGQDISSIDAVAVGRGPGSFTGVRIGVATAKGLACGLGKPLYGVSTLDAVAWHVWRGGVRGKLDAVQRDCFIISVINVDRGFSRR